MMKRNKRLDEQVGRIVGNNTFAARGWQYFKNGDISISSFDQINDDTYDIVARARGTRDYKQKIIISKNMLQNTWAIHDDKTSCTCPAFRTYGSCKHIAGALYEVQSRYQIFTVEKNNNQVITDSISKTVQAEINDKFAEVTYMVTPIVIVAEKQIGKYEVTISLTDNDLLYIPQVDVLSIEDKNKKKIDSSLGIIPQSILEFSETFTALLACFESLNLYKKYYGPQGKKYFTLQNAEISTFLLKLGELEIIPVYFFDFGSALMHNPSKQAPEDTYKITIKKGYPQATLVVDFPYNKSMMKDGLVELQLKDEEEDTSYHNYFMIDSSQLTIFPAPLQKLLGALLYDRFGRKNKDKKAIVQFNYIFEDLQAGTMLGLPLVATPDLEASIIKVEPTFEVIATKQLGYMTVEPFIKYGDIKIEALTKRQTSTEHFVYPNRVKEKQFLTLLDEVVLIGEHDWKSDNAIVERNPEAMFAFVYEGANQLVEAGVEVLLDETLRKMQQPSLGVSLDIAWLPEGLIEVDFEKEEDTSFEELASIMKQYKVKKRYLTLSNGVLLDTQNEKLKQQLEILETIDEDFEQFEQQTHVKMPMYRAFDYASKTTAFGANVKIDKKAQKMLADLQNPKPKPLHLQPELKAILRPYQLIGIYWMQALSKYHLGGVLADEMGLGKTLQVIAFLTTCTWEEPVMIVAPKTLIYNWESEFKKFAPQLKTTLIEGVPTERNDQWAHVKNSDIIITSYPLLVKDRPHLPEKFSYIFIDEAQYIKNPSTKAAKTLYDIPSTYRFALSGTPFENNLMELWSIFQFVMPGFFPPQKKFKTEILRPIHLHKDERTLELLKQKIQYVILRRLKSDVLADLPDKIETSLYCEMEKEQEQVYQYYLKQAQQEIRSELSENGFNRSRIKILAVLTRLRQVCTHPSTFLDGYTGKSAKMELLEEVLSEALASGHKILLFSQFTSMLQIIATSLEEKNIDYFYLHGQTKGPDRLKMVEEFNEPTSEKNVFLLSLKAGGTGLNLTAADIVIHFDPWWNPSVENQATDRAHRFGQKNTVQVFQFIVKDTIEEKIQLIKERKQELFNALFDSEQQAMELFSENDIKILLDL